MRQTHNMNLCCPHSLWHHLVAELLNANLVHHVGTAKGSAVDRRPGSYRQFALIPQLAGAKLCLARLPYYRQVKWRHPNCTLGYYVFEIRLPGHPDMPIER
jgi:hypothetical protein